MARRIRSRITFGVITASIVALSTGIIMCRGGTEPILNGEIISRIGVRPVLAQGSDVVLDSEALTLWKRTLVAQMNTPLSAHATITRWSASGQPDVPQIVNIVEGTKGQYRFTYIAPATVRGRIVVSDGKYISQYEPRQQVVLRRPAPLGNDILMGNSADYSSSHVQVLNKRQRIEGRSVRVLEVRGEQSNALRERRWIDEKTGRSLRIDEFGKGDHPIRRVELTQVAFISFVALKTFQIHFPHSVRVLSATARREPVPSSAAHLLKLPDVAAGYRLRSVVLSGNSPDNAKKLPIHDPQLHHLLYSNGVHSVSIFATEGKGAIEALRPAPGWRHVTLLPGIVGYSTSEKAQGRSAVAWVHSGRRYVAVGRIPLDRLVVLSRDLARGTTKTD